MTDYRIIEEKEEGSPTYYGVQYRAWVWWWRDVRYIVRVGPEIPLTSILRYTDIEEARAYIRRQTSHPDDRTPVTRKVVESYYG